MTRRASESIRPVFGLARPPARPGLGGGGFLLDGPGRKEDFLHRGQRPGGLLKAASSPVADEETAPFAVTHEQIRVTALWTGLRNRSHRESEVAVGIVDASV